ncbi:MAG TPA: amidohydrolase family protein [Blastocatellia bacterium]|nr:amidohydrolase family protein [Blastocatellia bacterium]
MMQGRRQQAAGSRQQTASQISREKAQKSQKKFLLFLFVFFAPLCGYFFLDSSAEAQTAETYAIRNARIVTVTGPVIENGTVVIANGKIAAVGQNVAAPSGAKVIDGKGLSVYPGLIDSGTTLGLEEIGSVAGSMDVAEIGDNNANIRADVAVHPDSSHINVARANGITTALTEPRGGAIAGQSALINLDGWTPKEMTFKAPVAMHINWPGAAATSFDPATFQPTRRSVAEARREQEKQIDTLKKILRDARAYGDAMDARAKDPSLPKGATDLRLAALVPVVRGQMPVVILANDERDIKGAIAFADEMKIKMILSGGAEAYKVADQLKAKNIPVLVGPVLRMPSEEDAPYDESYANAGLLAKAGVRIAFQTLDSADVRNLPYHAGMSAAYGLPKEEALKAVTIYPAEIFGVADRIGSIEQGKVANLIVTTGDPLEIVTQVKYMFINGRQVPLTSRHTELYERYKARP